MTEIRKDPGGRLPSIEATPATEQPATDATPPGDTEKGNQKPKTFQPVKRIGKKNNNSFS